MSTPRQLVSALRLGAVFALLGLTILLLGPFQWLVPALGLSDELAHAGTFYLVTLGLFAIAPRHRRTDLALAAFAFGILIEIAQGLTGRSASLTDLAANSAGILAALAPGMIERLRHHVRTSPDVTFASLCVEDRRKAIQAEGAKAGSTRAGATAR